MRRLTLIVFSLMVLLGTAVCARGSVTTPPVVKGAEQGVPSVPGVVDVDLGALPRNGGRNDGRPPRVVPRVLHPPASGTAPARRAVAPRIAATQQHQPATPVVRDPAFGTTIVNGEGAFNSPVSPADPNVAVGPRHVIQMVNDIDGSAVTIWDKKGNVLAGPFVLASIWTAGGACAAGFGDPMVVYDRLADRWLLSEFAATGNHLCVYVSHGDDERGDAGRRHVCARRSAAAVT